MGMSLGGGAGIKADMNVTPMIDVLLVLIVIFLIITPTTQRGLETLVPQSAASDTAPPPSHDIVISVEAGHAIRLNSESVDLAALESRLRAIYKNGSSRVAFVRGDKGLDYQDVANVIDLAKGAGAERIGLMTR